MTATIYHQVWINAERAKVYEAISIPDAIGTWWAKQTATHADRGLILEHDPGPAHGVVKLRVIEEVPNERVEWECVSMHPESSPASAWTGTHFVFEISEREAPCWTAPAEGATTMVVLDFRQTGYDERSPFFGFNNFAWGGVLQNLKQVIESRSTTAPSE